MNVLGILFDYETPLPVLTPQAVIEDYKQIVDEAASFVYKFVDSAIPYQENYPAPVHEINGKRFVSYQLTVKHVSNLCTVNVTNGTM